MRPIKLTMTGFESYKDKTTINFDELGTKGLYLISGDTGAGKTTIFDAITFVLYGSPSGTDRKVEMLRSHFADEKTPTEVELEFESNGKKYHIIRNPEYDRKALRGDGITKESANATLKFLSENRDPVSGLQKVDAEIEHILNLKKDQFCRIAMIAQGSFQELLLSKKEDKQALFRELFHTEKYQRLQETLKSDKAQAESDLKNLKLKLSEALRRIEVNEQDENIDEINRIKSSPVIVETDILILNDFVSKDEKLLAEIIKQITDVETKLEEINGDIQKGETQLKLQEQIKSNETSLALKRQRMEQLIEIANKAEEESKKIPELEKQKTLLENSLKDYEIISNEEEKLKALESQIKTDEITSEKKTQKNKELTTKLDNLKEEATGLKNAGEKIGTLEALLEKLSEEKETLDEIINQHTTLIKEQESLILKQTQVKKANADFSEANSSYTEKLNLFNLEQAGILAEGLQEGTACPVCGATEHPHLAKKSEKAPTQAEIEEAKELAEQLQKKASELSIEAGQKKTVVEKTEESINKLLKKYFNELTLNDENFCEKIDEKKTALKNQTEDTRKNLQQERSAKARHEEIDNLIPQIEAQIKESAEELKVLQIKISSNRATLQSDSNKLTEKKNDLQYKTLAEAKSNFTLLTNRIKELKNNLDTAKQNQITCEKEIATSTGEIESLKKQLKETKTVDLEELTSTKVELIDRKNALNEQKDSLIERKGINQDSVKTVEELIPEIAKATNNYNMISALNDVATGSNRGKIGKPSLEVYVQMHCLDQINRRANLRLKTMTENKYELRRRIEEDGSELGLELNIKDFYTGRERNVKTLSGGEQFQASLSLALGLADEIQESAGGIKLDTMFIDEGFGTLDPETLNKAMKALENLSQGDKLIGIISHVEELESRIPKKILVKKDEAGVSHLTLLND